MIFMGNDFRREFSTQKKKITAISMPTRKEKVEQLDEEPPKKKKRDIFKRILYFTRKWTFLNIIAVVGFMMACYGAGKIKGEEIAKEKFPQEFSNLKTSLTISEDKNIEIMTENKSLQAENDMLKANITELEVKASQKEDTNNSLDNIYKETKNNPNHLSESHFINEGDSAVYFDNELYIAVQTIITDSNYIRSVNVKVSSPGFSTESFEKIGVGEKVYYSTDTDKYEILVSSISSYNADIFVNAIEQTITKEQEIKVNH